MTRQDILNQYRVSPAGKIENPGRYEGEMLYIPYFWEQPELATRDGGRVLGFDISKEDKVQFSELKGRRTVNISISSQGFICEMRMFYNDFREI